MPNLQVEAEVQTPSMQPSPVEIFETLQSHQKTMALKGAIDLELFTHIARGAHTAATIAVACQANERAVRILCDYLTIAGFLRKGGEEYGLMPVSSVFLDKQSPAYMGSVAEFIASPEILARYRDVAALVRKGGALDTGLLTPENDIWVSFAKSMVPMVILAAQGAAHVIAEPGRPIKVLDIAAGHGMFGISVARQNRVAQITALDWRNTLGVAVQNAAKAGIEARFHTIPGDAFEVDLGADYDLVIVANFFHHFDAPTNIGLLKRIRAAMSPSGRVATIDFVPNDDRVSPPTAAAFSLTLLASTERGDTFTLRQYDEMFRSAGFGESHMQTLAPTPMALILTSK
jgi:ubiquinone/menaquinone biosynthesis C-methylase UbiE